MIMTCMRKRLGEVMTRDEELHTKFFYGLRRIKYVWHGEWNDPEVIYRKESFCYWDVEDALYDMYMEGEDPAMYHLGRGLVETEHFNEWISTNKETVYGMLNDWTQARKEIA